ncbi:Signal recognition particle 14 kDa protein [Pseudolycoriella hygida]|uniref:Signal recognition particle 14 kDa protein n=1 Tax=Pseudolycoriella hygida TaxID=35572 RepID=A0A9Q0MWE9_9DIPT|nr:Signal recognition particle 14 kDa protein [Pseudolycoriella hygida]
MVLLNNEELTLLTSRARNGSFTVTFKRYDGRDKPTPREGKPPLPISEYRCLIRAQSKSKKLSTVVNQNEILKFMEAYGKVMKTSMDGLKKVKKPKTKSKVAHG